MFISFILGAFLLLYKITAHNVWVDEAYSISVSSKPLYYLYRAVFSQDPHPPLYYLLLKLWCSVFGFSQTSGIILSILFGLLAAYMGCVLSSHVFNNVTWPLAFLILTSPFFIMFSRMIRYYSFVAFLGVSLLFLFIKFIESDKKRWWFALLGAHIVMIYSDYPGSMLFIGELCALFILRKHYPKKLFLLILIFGITAIAFAPWSRQLFYHINALSSLSTKASLSGNHVGLLTRIVFSLYDFMFGECVFPWNWTRIVPLFCLYLWGFVSFWREFPKFQLRTKQLALMLLIITAVSFLGGIFMANKVVNKQSFIYMPSRIMFCFIPFIMLIGQGFSAKRKLCFIMTLTTVIFNVVILQNFYACTNYINPVYMINWNDAVMEIKRQYLPGDLIISDEIESPRFYLGADITRVIFMNNEHELKRFLEMGTALPQSLRIFLLTTERQSTQSSYFSEELLDLFKRESRTIFSKDYAEISPMYYDLLKKATNRPHWYKMHLKLINVSTERLRIFFKTQK